MSDRSVSLPGSLGGDDRLPAFDQAEVDSDKYVRVDVPITSANIVSTFAGKDLAEIKAVVSSEFQRILTELAGTEPFDSIYNLWYIVGFALDYAQSAGIYFSSLNRSRAHQALLGELARSLDRELAQMIDKIEPSSQYKEGLRDGISRAMGQVARAFDRLPG